MSLFLCNQSVQFDIIIWLIISFRRFPTQRKVDVKIDQAKE